MAQTIVLGDQITPAPAQAGVPKLQSSYDPDQLALDALAAEGNVASLRVDLEPFATALDEEPTVQRVSVGDAGEDYEAALVGWPEISRAGRPDSDGRQVAAGGSKNTAGELVVVNPRSSAPAADADGEDIAGERDAWRDGYIWDQRPATLAAVARREAQADATVGEIVAGPVVIFRGRTTNATPSEDGGALSIGLTDLLGQLDRRIQSVRLKGTGGLEGGPALAGVRPRLVFGSPQGSKCLLLTKVPYPTYLLHRDREGNSIQGLSGLYSGVNLIDPSDYSVVTAADSEDGASNYVMIDGVSLDDSKEVTADVVGPAAAGSAVADFIRFALIDLGELDATLVDAGEFARFREQAPWQAGWVVEDENKTIREFIDEITSPWAFWQQDAASGMIIAGVSSEPDLRYVDHVIQSDALISVVPATIVKSRPEVATGYLRNWNEVGEDGVAGAARGTERGDWAQQPHYRIADAPREGLSDLYPSETSARDFVTPFLDAVAARIVHSWLKSKFSYRWRPYSIVTDVRFVQVEANSVIQVDWPRWADLDGGAALYVESVRIVDSGGSVPRVAMLAWRLEGLAVLGGNTNEQYLATADGGAMRVR